MTENIKNKPTNQIIILIALILIGTFSFLYLSKALSAPEANAATIASLDEKRNTVMKLAAAAVASSTAIAAIPGDATTPIANEIAGLTSYFIVILAAISLEKMLITVVGTLAFTYIIPAACLLAAIYVFYRKEVILVLAFKLAVFGVLLYAAIPASIHISDMLYASHQTSINETLVTAEQNKGYIEEKKNELSADDQNWMGKVGDYLSDFTSKIGANLSAMVKKGEDTLASFMDAVAVLIITSCVIPLVVLLIFAWIIRILFGFDIKGLLPKRRKTV